MGPGFVGPAGRQLIGAVPCAASAIRDLDQPSGHRRKTQCQHPVRRHAIATRRLAARRGPSTDQRGSPIVGGPRGNTAILDDAEPLRRHGKRRCRRCTAISPARAAARPGLCTAAFSLVIMCSATVSSLDQSSSTSASAAARYADQRNLLGVTVAGQLVAHCQRKSSVKRDEASLWPSKGYRHTPVMNSMPLPGDYIGLRSIAGARSTNGLPSWPASVTKQAAPLIPSQPANASPGLH